MKQQLIYTYQPNMEAIISAVVLYYYLFLYLHFVRTLRALKSESQNSLTSIFVYNIICKKHS